MNSALDTSMFWVGAMFAFTPILVGGSVIAVWWWHRRRDAEARRTSPESGSGRPAAGGG